MLWLCGVVSLPALNEELTWVVKLHFALDTTKTVFQPSGFEVFFLKCNGVWTLKNKGSFNLRVLIPYYISKSAYKTYPITENFL